MGKSVDVTKEQVDEVFAKAETQIDYVLGLYALAYGDEWARVKQVQGFPKAGILLHQYLFERAIEWDKAHSHGYGTAGLTWMNNGFAQDKECNGWYVELAEVEWIDG